MPEMRIVMDVDTHGGFDAIHARPNGLIHVPDPRIEIGTLRGGMHSGKDSVAICIPLPDGKVLLAETSAELFLSAAGAIKGWQERRRDLGEI